MEALDFMAAFGVPDIGEWALDAWLGPVYDVLPCPICRGPPCEFSFRNARSFYNFSEYGLCQTCQDAYLRAAGVPYAGQYAGRLHAPFDGDDEADISSDDDVPLSLSQFGAALVSDLYSSCAHPHVPA